MDKQTATALATAFRIPLDVDFHAPDPARAVRMAQGEAIASDYGGPNELREFVDSGHKREDYVALAVLRGRHPDVRP